MPERVILDSSVIIAAALKPRGATRRFLAAIDEADDIEIVWSQKLGYELHEKFYGGGTVAAEVAPAVKQALLEWLEARATLVEDVKLDNPLPLANDRDDDYLVALARRERAWLVTLDTRLTSSSPHDLNAVRPAELLSRLE